MQTQARELVWAEERCWALGNSRGWSRKGPGWALRSQADLSDHSLLGEVGLVSCSARDSCESSEHPFLICLVLAFLCFYRGCLAFFWGHYSLCALPRLPVPRSGSHLLRDPSCDFCSAGIGNHQNPWEGRILTWSPVVQSAFPGLFYSQEVRSL